MNVYLDGILRETWDDTARVFTAYDTAGNVTETRPYTPLENAQADAEATQQTANTNRDSLHSKAQAALTNNATYLAITAPTNAQVVAQVRALTRQVNALIRLEINQLDDVSNT